MDRTVDIFHALALQKAQQQAESLLIRLESQQGDVVATAFDEEMLGIGTREDIEVR